MPNPDDNAAVEETITIPNRINLAAILEEVDHTRLVVALVATNPELEDILPDDPQLKRDVANVREQIAERQVQSGGKNESADGVQNIVAQHVHIHLWDQQTSERVKELGASVVGLFQNIRDQLIQAKEKYIDGDNRDVISFDEALDGFKNGLGGMVDFMTRRDRAAETPEGGYPPGAGPWGVSKELVEALPAADEEAVVRLASSAVGEVLDEKLEPVSAPDPAKAVYSFGNRDRSEPEPPMDDFLDGPPLVDDTLYVVRSSTLQSPHYITDKAGENTYDKAEAAQFPLDEAEKLAGDHSDYAATKGYGYRYQIEEAGAGQAQQLHAGASLSR